MARNSSSSKSKPKTPEASTKPKQPAATRHRLNPEAETAPTGLIDAQGWRDIIAVALIVLGLALLATVTLRTDAVVSSAIAVGLHMGLGLGAYLVPLILIGIGCTLLGLRKETLPGRVWLGLAIIILTTLCLLALSTPGVNPDNTAVLIAGDNPAMRGGYLGAAIVSVGIHFLGTIITGIILIGFLIVGFVMLGFSLSDFVAQLQERQRQRAEAAQNEEPLAPPAFIQRISDSFTTARNTVSIQKVAPIADEQFSSAQTHAFTDDDYDCNNEYANSDSAFNDIYTDDGFSYEENSCYQPTVAFDEHITKTRTHRLSDDFKDIKDSTDDDTTRDHPQKPLTTVFDPAPSDFRPLDATEVLPEVKVNPTPEAKPAPKPKVAPPAPPAEDGSFVLPPATMLTSSVEKPSQAVTKEELTQVAYALQTTLEDFKINAKVVDWVAGPTLTLFKIELPSGVRLSRVTSLQEDIALSLASVGGVRVIGAIPGTNYVGIEVPNATRQTVYLADVLKDAKPGPLQMAIGMNVEGESIVCDLATMPHLLIGGTTGSGKSVAINGMIMSILMRATPEEVRFIMIDPKRVEFSLYNDIPHLYTPVVTEPKEAASALAWACAEMERRLKVFEKVHVRNIKEYSAKVKKELAAREEAEKNNDESFEPNENLASELPYIVIVIDELADLMMNVGKEVEFSISRIAQLARAAGIHLIIATQRPSAQVVTGLIKANITDRIAFNVATGIDSRVILDTVGAENLIGNGDLLLSKKEFSKPQRLQGCFVSGDEIEAVVAYLKAQGEPEYHSEILQTNIITLGASSPSGSGGSCTSDDPLLWEAADIVTSSGLGSTSNIQRRLSVGYARAGRIMDMLEEKGIVGPANGSKPREVLVDSLELETIKAFEMHDGVLEG